MGQRNPEFRTPATVTSIAAGGHRERFLATRDELVREHLPMVDSIARSVIQSLPPSFDVEDLISAGRIELIRAATRYRPKQHGGTPFSAYARVCVRGAILDSCRRRQYEEATRPPIDREQMEEPDREISIDRGRLWRRVEVAIGELPEDQRQVMNGYYAPDEPSFATVAERLRIPTTRAKVLHSRAVDNLRKFLRAV